MLSPFLTRLAFALALILVCARATVHEILRDPIPILPGIESPPRAPGPASSLAFDLLFCIPALLVLLRRVLDPQYVLRISFLHWIMLALATWALLSIAWASDQFSASIGAMNFAAALALLWSLTQLVRSWKRFRIAAAVLFGLLLVYTAAGLNRRLIDFPDQVKSWNDPNSPTGRKKYLENNQLTENDFAFQAFQRRLLSGEVAV